MRRAAPTRSRWSTPRNIGPDIGAGELLPGPQRGYRACVRVPSPGDHDLATRDLGIGLAAPHIDAHPSPVSTTSSPTDDLVAAEAASKADHQ